MTLYSLALFLHLLSLAVAFAAAGLIHFAMARLWSARTVQDARAALALDMRVGHAMPIAGVALLLTGAYMTQDAWTWSTGWIDVSIAGLVALEAVGGGMIGPRASALQRVLDAAGDGPLGPEVAARVRDPALQTISNLPTALAVGVIFVMVVKPSAAGGIAALIVAAALDALVAAPRWRAAPSGAAALVARDAIDAEVAR